jgi:hypothetical protein
MFNGFEAMADAPFSLMSSRKAIVMTARTTFCDGISRREMLRMGTLGIPGLTLPNLLRMEAHAQASKGAEALEKRKASAVILVNLGGGPATIDMWDLKPDAPEDIRGPFKPINTNVDGIQIGEHLPKMAKIIDKVAIVRSLTHTLPVHGIAATWMFTGNVPTPVLRYPHLGALAARLLPNEKGVPPFVMFDGDSPTLLSRLGGYLGPGFNPFLAEAGHGNTVNPNTVKLRGITLPGSFPLEELENREKLLANFDRGFEAAERASDLVDGLDAFHQKALELLRSEKTRTAFNVEKEPKALLESYGLNPSGLGLIVARRLVEAGTRFVSVNVGYQGAGGWDTHANNFEVLKTRHLPVLDQALSALLRDLSDRGLLDKTIVYCCGEMGRTPQINKDAGRDHWSRAQAVILAGGGFKRGMVYGSTDAKGMDPAGAACSPDDVAATIFHCLGLDPQQELNTPTGRAIHLFREGKILKGILA